MEKVAFLISHRNSCDANNCPSGSTLTSGSMFRTAYSKCQSHCSSHLLPTRDYYVWRISSYGIWKMNNHSEIRSRNQIFPSFPLNLSHFPDKGKFRGASLHIVWIGHAAYLFAYVRQSSQFSKANRHPHPVERATVHTALTLLYMWIKNPTDATVCRYLFTAKLLYMFRVSQHPSSGVSKTVPAASGTGHTTCTATPLLRGLVWKGVVVQVVWPVPEAAGTVLDTPDNGCCDTRNM